MERAYANRPDTVAPQQSKGATKPVKMVDALGNPSVSKPLSTLTGSSKPLSPSMGSSKPLPSFLPGKPKSTVSPRTEGMEKEKVAAKEKSQEKVLETFNDEKKANITTSGTDKSTLEDPPGLPSPPVHGQVASAQDGRLYIYVVDEQGNGSWGNYAGEGEAVYTQVVPPPMYGKVTGVGSSVFFLSSTEGAGYASKDQTELGVKKGEIITFKQSGIKYNAEFDADGAFRGYYSIEGKQFEPRFMVNGVCYKANSIQTMSGRDDANDFTGNFKGIIRMDDGHMMEMLAYGLTVFNIWNNDPKEQTALAQSIDWGGSGDIGMLDFKNVLYKHFNWDSQALINYRGIVYNANEIGNLVWACVLHNEGLFIDPNDLAEYGTIGRYDEAHEQKAVSKGKNISHKIFSSKRKQTQIRALIPIIREMYQR